MAEQELLKRITTDPKIFGGKPIVRGMRISVELVLSLLAQGEAAEAILDDYPDLGTRGYPRLPRLRARGHRA